MELTNGDRKVYIPKLDIAAKREINRTLTTDHSDKRSNRDFSDFIMVDGKEGKHRYKPMRAIPPRILTIIIALRQPK